VSPLFRAYTPFVAGPPGLTPEAVRAVDGFALDRVTLAALVALVGGILYVGELVVGNIGSLAAASTSPSGGVTLTLPPVWVWVVLLGGGSILTLVEIVLFRSGFRRIAGIDLRFSTPSTLTLIAVIGFLLLYLGLILLIGALYSAVSCAGSGNPVTTVCLLGGEFWGGLALAAIGGIVALVGYIGMLIGIWRLGTRYGDGLFKAGAVLLIFPVLNLIGAILLLVAARGAQRKVRRNLGSTAPPVPPSF
jgi:hypothetical protein